MKVWHQLEQGQFKVNYKEDEGWRNLHYKNDQGRATNRHDGGGGGLLSAAPPPAPHTAPLKKKKGKGCIQETLETLLKAVRNVPDIFRDNFGLTQSNKSWVMQVINPVGLGEKI